MWSLILEKDVKFCEVCLKTCVKLLSKYVFKFAFGLGNVTIFRTHETLKVKTYRYFDKE